MPAEKKRVLGRRNMPGRQLDTSTWDNESTDSLPEVEREVLNAKMFLMTQTDPDQPSLYDHLSGLITKLLEEKPDTIAFSLEDMSRYLKYDRLSTSTHLLRTKREITPAEKITRAQHKLLQKTPKFPDIQNDDSTLEPKFQGVPDIMRQASFFEVAGVGLPREDFVRITLALQDLVDQNPEMQSIRFWGKILGTRSNYYVAEVEFADGDYESEVDETEELGSVLLDEDSTGFDDLTGSASELPQVKKPPKIPCEVPGTGLNKKVYFVCAEPGLPWLRLPHVTPSQIQVARKIRKFFTGDLNAPVVTHPPFPGVERNYLRAQIARISASTHISPLGYYRFDDEGEEEEEMAEEGGGARNGIVVDLDYDGFSTRDLADSSLQTWVHHSPAILPQGRITWYNPVGSKAVFNEEDEEEEEEEERNEPDEPQPEVGPPLLTPLAEDENVGKSPPWISYTSSKFLPEFAIAVLQSNVWIGAMAFAADRGRFFENIYIGWGQKNLEDCFEPSLPEEPMAEFPSGPEVTEADDPTPEEEAAVRAALQEKELEAEFEENIDHDDDVDEDIVDDDGEGGDQFDDDL